MRVVVKGGLGLLPGHDVTLSHEQYAEMARRAAAAKPDPFMEMIDAGVAAEQAKAAGEHEIALDAAELERVGAKYVFCIEEKAPQKLTENIERKYIACNQVFAEHCQGRGVKSLPVREGILAGYLDKLIEQGITYQKLRLVVEAVNHRHKLADLFEPGRYPLIRAMLLFAKRKSRTQTERN
jgi:hypothetical protein